MAENRPMPMATGDPKASFVIMQSGRPKREKWTIDVQVQGRISASAVALVRIPEERTASKRSLRGSPLC